MTQLRYKATNWKRYNQALINRGRVRLFSDLTITTALLWSNEYFQFRWGHKYSSTLFSSSLNCRCHALIITHALMIESKRLTSHSNKD